MRWRKQERSSLEHRSKWSSAFALHEASQLQEALGAEVHEPISASESYIFSSEVM